MNRQAVNPYLPSWEYIPDGEPHVFNGRVYVYGSHDRFNAPIFCVNDYVCWSAPVEDLSEWRYEGVIYRKKQDPKNPLGYHLLFAPDVCQGPDGRYYLYYAFDFLGIMSVAVCDTPAGEYKFLGHIHYADGTLWGRRRGDQLPFDPGVLVDDDGRVWLYSGFYNAVPAILTGGHKLRCDGGTVLELEKDMVTIKTEPRVIFPKKGPGAFQGHEFFEASSIRKIGSQYYFIYSSMKGHELCYATSSYPDRDFRYGGVIISNGDIGFNGRNDSARLNTTGTNHGSIECINGQWYVFYHRNTHKSAYSRQACVERIALDTSGNIKQTEITSLGFSKSLKTDKTYPASICCNLYSGRMPHIGNGISSKNIPYIAESSNKQIVIATNKTKMVYKYFEVEAGHYILSIKCTGQESFEADISTFEEWNNIKIPIVLQSGTLTLSIEYKGPKILFVESLRICRNSKM